MATASRRTTRSSSKNGTSANGQTRAKTRTSAKVTPEKLANTLIAAAEKKFGVKLETREQRISKKVGYATRERLGKNLLGLAKDDFSWDTWNKIFAKIFGEPTALKYPPEIVAMAMAIIYHDIPNSAEAAVQALIEYNDRSLEERNKREREERDRDLDLNDIEELLDEDDELDDEEEEDLDFVDEDEDEDLKDFDDDELDDFDED